jgi:tRNA (mo5U34)-methyltransferase
MNPLDSIVRPALFADTPEWRNVLDTARNRVAGHGDYDRWNAALSALPALAADEIELTEHLSAAGRATADERDALESALRALHPWRKGPFDLFGIHVDTEWRSDWKWQRIAGALGDLSDQRVLDVGCGNGYFGWRLLGAGASGVLGVDPTVPFFFQHLALCRYLGAVRPNDNPAQSANFLLPIPFEILPAHPFDLVLSMGVAYHRPDPPAHVQGLYAQTRPGGRVLLESLVVTEGPDLFPAAAGNQPGRGRYARMRNVHMVPRLETMTGWLTDAGFTGVQVIDVTRTRPEEQRTTSWMTFESLPHCLDPDDPGKTVEGYPAPVRAAVIARRGVASSDS